MHQVKSWCVGRGFQRVVCSSKDEQQIIIDFTRMNGELFMVTIVYVSKDIIMRKNLWNVLIGIDAMVNEPWMVLGDFNFVLSVQERVGGADVRPYHYADFVDCVNITGLADMKYGGNLFTWNNRQERRIACKLDRVLINSLWMGSYADFEAEFMNPCITSDHSCIKVSSIKQTDGGKKAFHFTIGGLWRKTFCI